MIAPQANAQFVAAMEQVLDIYSRCRFTFNLSLLNFHLAPTPFNVSPNQLVASNFKRTTLTSKPLQAFRF